MLAVLLSHAVEEHYLPARRRIGSVGHCLQERNKKRLPRYRAEMKFTAAHIPEREIRQSGWSFGSTSRG